jgi:hypothetical protein
MKKIIFSAILFAAIATNSFAQRLSKEQAKADLQFCYDALKVAHPSLYRYTKEEEYNTIYKFLDDLTKP